MNNPFGLPDELFGAILASAVVIPCYHLVWYNTHV